METPLLPELYYETGNFSYDLVGIPDTRPSTWGRASVQYSELSFNNIPANKQVRIVEITGDVTAWPIPRDEPAQPSHGHYAGVLGAITTVPRSSGSLRAFPSADDTLVYVQGIMGPQGGVRIPIHEEFDERVVNAVLPHGKLWFKMSDYLNDTPFNTHAEITFKVTFCYEAAR